MKGDDRIVKRSLQLHWQRGGSLSKQHRCDIRGGFFVFFLLVVLVSFCFAARAAEARLTQPDPQTFPDLFMWTDTANVYVLRDGDAALLIDLGDGSVLDHLGQIGVKRVEWVLFTHHHREQCQGYPKLKAWNAKTAAPEAERELFETPFKFRRMKVRLKDPFTVYGASYVRPPIQPLSLDRTFQRLGVFDWRKYKFWCVATPGNSPGAMSYMLKQGDGWFAFSGDVMVSGAQMHTWFDTEWDYGFGAGIYAIYNSAGQLAGYDPAWLLPSHGPPIRRPASELYQYQQKLRRLEKLYLRGYDVSTFAAGDLDKVSRPSLTPHVWQVSPHLFKFRGPDFFYNFSLILADSGRALVVDCRPAERRVFGQGSGGLAKRLRSPDHRRGGDHPYARRSFFAGRIPAGAMGRSNLGTGPHGSGVRISRAF